MDNKPKQDLTPELKEIYEKIMNTKVSPSASPASAGPAQTLQANVPVKPNTPPLSTPVQSPTAPKNPVSNASPNPNPNPEMPNLSSVQPRPIKETSTPFVFSSSSKIEDVQKEATVEKVEKKGGMGSTLIILLMVLFLAGYTVFWLMFFGILNKPF